MKLTTAAQMTSIDRRATVKYGIPSIVLMENAGVKSYLFIKEQVKDFGVKRFYVFSGKGSNGGDGICLARHLFNNGLKAKLFLLCRPEELQGDSRINFDIYEKMGAPYFVIDSSDALEKVKYDLFFADIIVDAIYGTGFKGALAGYIKTLAGYINSLNKYVVALDIPTGIEADTGYADTSAIRADATVAFSSPKLGEILYPGAKYCGQITVADIGIPALCVDEEIIKTFITTKELVKNIYPALPIDSHKGDAGKLAVLAGSPGMTGAAYMASEGALRAGTGLVTLLVPESLNVIMEQKLTEAMTYPLKDGGGGYFACSQLEDILSYIKGGDAMAVAFKALIDAMAKVRKEAEADVLIAEPVG